MKGYSFTKAEQTIINKFEKTTKELENVNEALEKLATKIEKQKINKGNSKEVNEEDAVVSKLENLQEKN
ncbi:hypothetical protein [Enterococcus avium]|uniref:hypothetical protein n=1 Tax=Enterococcus avium TaxID=33945 RepID=UPI003D0FD5ED